MKTETESQPVREPVASADLLPCPLCASPGELIETHKSHFSVQCANGLCGIRPQPQMSPLAAVTVWNDRPEIPAEPTILPVKPGTLSKSDKAALRNAGVVVIEHEQPSDLRLLKPNAELSASEMLLSAMRGVMAEDGKARYVFAKNFLSFLEEAHARRSAG